MSFIYSRALVEEFSQANCLDIGPSVPSNASPTHRPCLWHDKTMESFHLSRFGMTCKPLKASRGAELLTWWRAGSPVKTLVLQEKAQALTANEAVCGRIWPASLAKYDPDTSLWRTAQYSLLGGLDEFSETWPRWGLMRDGECWELPALAPTTSESASGLLPTPTAIDSGSGRFNTSPGSSNRRPTLALMARKGLWPTTVISTGGATSEMNGPLNPDWVEWLMGWPIGHTALKPLGTAKYLEWQRQHSKYYARNID